MHRIGDDILQPYRATRHSHGAHDERNVLSLRFIASEAMLVDLERANLRFER